MYVLEEGIDGPNGVTWLTFGAYDTQQEAVAEARKHKKGYWRVVECKPVWLSTSCDELA